MTFYFLKLVLFWSFFYPFPFFLLFFLDELFSSLCLEFWNSNVLFWNILVDNFFLFLFCFSVCLAVGHIFLPIFIAGNFLFPYLWIFLILKNLLHYKIWFLDCWCTTPIFTFLLCGKESLPDPITDAFSTHGPIVDTADSLLFSF